MRFDIELAFKIALQDLGLAPDYKLLLSAEIPSLKIYGTNDLGTACRFERAIWIQKGLKDLKTVKILLHESRHLYQMEILKLKLPDDRLFMEEDAGNWASENLLKYYQVAKNGKALNGLEAIKAGINLYKEL